MSDNFLENPSVLGGCVYYAQNREDLILQSFFPDVKKGFYVDVGAFDPDYDSVTKLFYLNGWSGINIEPQVERYNQFQRDRKRDTNLNIGIAVKESTLTLRTYKSAGLATFSSDVKQKYEKNPDEDTTDYVETKVKVYPLSSVLKENKVDHIDFMKVDVEGLEYEVLASNNWDRFRPEVLCIEANHMERDWRPILKTASYKEVFDDGLNVYYVDTKTDRESKFHFVKDVINDRGGGVRADIFQRMFRLYEYGTQKNHHVEELVRENERLQRRLNDTKELIEEYETSQNSTRATAGRLLKLIKRNLGR